MNDIIETIDLGSYKGFDLKLNALVEYMTVSDSFDMDEKEMNDIYNKLDRYELMWFCANVSAYKNGIKLSDDYLGGCLYESLEKFINDGDYIEDMKETVIKEAKQVIQQLIQPFLVLQKKEL